MTGINQYKRIFLVFIFLFVPLVVNGGTEILYLPYPSAEKYVITRGYGLGLTCQQTTHCKKDLYALDFARDKQQTYGQPVLAVINGQILQVNRYDIDGGGYGYFVKISHDNLISMYAHLSEINPDISDGVNIKSGQLIGKMGNTGSVYPRPTTEDPLAGTHLHFAVYQKQVDGALVAYKPEPMSGYTNFLVGNWYISDNQVYDPNHIYAQQGGSQLSPTPNKSWWQIVLGALTDVWNGITQTVTHFFAPDNPTDSSSPTINPADNNSSPSSTSTMAAQIISPSQTINLQPGEEKRISITVKNTGADAWQPAQQVSLNVFNQTAKDLYHPSWSTRLRPVILLSPTPAGQTAQFSFNIVAPVSPGEYTATWQLVYTPDGQNFVRLGSDLATLNLIVTKPEILTNNQPAETPAQNNSPDQNSTTPTSTPLIVEQNNSSGGGSSGGGGGGGSGENNPPQDTTPPETTIDNLADLKILSNVSSIAFQFSANEDGSHFECQFNGQGWQSCVSPQNYTGLAEGQNQFQVRAIDASNNIDPTPAEFIWAIDQTAPKITLVSYPVSPTNQTSAQFTFSLDDNDATTECSPDDAGWQACSSGQSYDNLAEGNHLLSLRAKDLAGNYSQPLDIYWTIDLTKPISDIDASFSQAFFNSSTWPGKIFGSASSPQNDLSVVEATLRRQSDNKYLSYTSSTADWIDDPTWLSADLNGSQWSLDLSNLSLTDDQYIAASRATDTAGNIQNSLSTANFIFDQTLPGQISDLQFNFDQDHLQLSLSWSAAADNLSGVNFYDVAWQVDGADYSTSTPSTSLVLPVQAAHNYSFRIRAVDKAQNNGDYFMASYEPKMSLQGWGRRKTLVVDNSASQEDLINFPVNALVNYESEMNNDFSDVRFADSDGTTLLNFGWDIDANGVENKHNGVSANAVIEIPRLNASEQKTIYMYYDKPDAPAVADLAKAISWYDHFTARKNDYETKRVGWDLSDTGFIKTNFVGHVGLDGWIYLKSSPFLKDVDIFFKVLTERDFRGGNVVELMRWRWIDDNNYFGLRGYFTGWDPSGQGFLPGDLQFVKVLDGQVSVLYSFAGVLPVYPPNPAQWIMVDVKSLGDQHTIALNNQDPVVIQDSGLNQAGKVIYMSLFGTYNTLDKFWADWFYVRPITDPMPSVY